MSLGCINAVCCCTSSNLQLQLTGLPHTNVVYGPMCNYSVNSRM